MKRCEIKQRGRQREGKLTLTCSRRGEKEEAKKKRKKKGLDVGTQGKRVCGRLVNSRRDRRDGEMELSAEER